MPDIKHTHPALPLILNAIPEQVDSLVDVGCGRGIIGALCRIYREPSRIVGLDAFEDYLEFGKQFKFYDKYMHWDVKMLPLPFEDKEFEVVTCIEVIEHLPKESGEQLLAEMERIAQYVVIATPNNFYEQDEYDHNPYQKHLSLWNAGDFKKRRYKVFGVGNMKVFGKPLKYISRAFGPMTRHFPSFSTYLLCIKDMRSN